VRYSWRDPRNQEREKSEQGLLLLDHTGCIALARKVEKNILPVLRACLHYGLDPAGVAEMLPEGGTVPEYLDALDKIISDNSPRTTDASETNRLCGGGVAQILTGDLFGKRIALAMILGVCPIFLLRFPQITDASLLSFISTKERLKSSAGAPFLRNRFLLTSGKRATDKTTAKYLTSIVRKSSYFSGGNY
jgi:hypothetical protein